MGKRPLRVLDVGGGDGTDSIYYAGLGHSVTLIDCSDRMLSGARKLAEKEGVVERLTVHREEAGAIADLLKGNRFDLMLCHNMIEFVPDAQGLLRDMCRLLAPGGILSIIDTNRYSDVYMNAFQVNSLSDALKAVGARERFHPWVDRLAPRFSADEFIDRLPGNGCALLGHYGVLNICGYLPNEPKFDPEYFTELEKLEHHLTDAYPYYLLAKFFQVIAEKTQ